MTSKALVQRVKAEYAAAKETLNHNGAAIDMYEGNLLPYVLADLKAQLTGQSYDAARHRVAPINLLTKITDKLSAIYQPAPVRRLIGDGVTDTDKKLLAYYIEQMDINPVMQQAAAMLALCKATSIQPIVHNGQPQARVGMNDRFFVFSDDDTARNSMTHFVTVYNEAIRNGGFRQIFWVYSADSFFICDSDDKVRFDLMSQLGVEDTGNVYGTIPFTYASSSRTRLMPNPDTDILAMTKLIPVLLSDLNYAVMFQSFSIMYGIDVDDNGIARAPNAFWNFKSDPNTDKKPEIGTIKPSVDIDAVIGLIQSELSLWLNSRGIRPGTVGQLDKDSFASGVSKLIDEMDTYEGRERLCQIMVKVEANFWNLIMHHMHPAWMKARELEGVTGLFTPDIRVETLFQAQAPMVSRGVLVEEQAKEIQAKFTTRKRALKKLNPQMSDDEIDTLIAEIDAEGTAPAALEKPKGGNFTDEKANQVDDKNQNDNQNQNQNDNGKAQG